MPCPDCPASPRASRSQLLFKELGASPRVPSVVYRSHALISARWFSPIFTPARGVDNAPAPASPPTLTGARINDAPAIRKLARLARPPEGAVKRNCRHVVPTYATHIFCFQRRATASRQVVARPSVPKDRLLQRRSASFTAKHIASADRNRVHRAFSSPCSTFSCRTSDALSHSRTPWCRGCQARFGRISVKTRDLPRARASSASRAPSIRSRQSTSELVDHRAPERSLV